MSSILDTSIVNVALERLSVAFSAPIESPQWVVSGYTVSLAALLLTGGRLGDRYAARNVYLAGLGLFTLYRKIKELGWGQCRRSGGESLRLRQPRR